MTTEAENRKLQLHLDVLGSFKHEYAQAMEKWRDLDIKAQGITAISGIFVAGILAFILDLSDDQGLLVKGVLTLSVVSLVCSVFFALAALRIRFVPEAPLGEHLETMTKDLIDNAMESDFSRYLNFVRDQSNNWRKVNTEIRRVNKSKVRYLGTSQWTLAIAALLMILIALISIWYS